MGKIKVKKRKLRLGRLLLILLILVVIYFGLDQYLKMKIENIVIKGNSHLSDFEVIETANIGDYPSFYWTSSNSIKRRLLANPIVKDVTVKKTFYHKIVIEVEENKVLFQKMSDLKVVLEDKSEYSFDKDLLGVIKLMNYIPDTKYDSFINHLLEVKQDILEKISEIEYCPNEFDKDRFLLYMDDGNSVYLTLTKFDMINYYDEVLPQLEGRKGILYLDSGNHFQIME